MAYEYEIKIPMWLEDGRWLNMNVDDEVLEELEEVYRKAKAFDEVFKILDVYLGDVEDEINALSLIREKLEGMDDDD